MSAMGTHESIVMARAQLADPDFCNKAQEGRLNDIRYCIGCNQECYDYFAASLSDPNINHITCMRNPALLEEEAWGLKQGNTSKKILIIGGGIAGIVGALDLKKTGNKPVIFEKENHLGGQFVLAGAAPGKSDFHYAAKKAAANVWQPARFLIVISDNVKYYQAIHLHVLQYINYKPCFFLISAKAIRASLICPVSNCCSDTSMSIYTASWRMAFS
ncbi:hypothetical protein C806_03484 [Lachnospiraceae bacterium 3-1]|nr:hypothetical protein C806_03484 [Lachnospiraceae bacterium 3-1]